MAGFFVRKQGFRCVGTAADAGAAGRLYTCPAPCRLAALHSPQMFRQPRPPDPDQELVTRAQQGDTRAFDALILKYGDKLYSLVYNMTSHKEDTHDLLQEIFARAYSSLQKFRGHSTFYTWLYQIAVNLTLNFLKKRKRRSGVSLNDLDAAAQADAALIDGTSELQKKLNDAMQRLSESHRMVVTMFDIQGMPHGEIAGMLKVSEGTVRSRLHYAHLQLQSALQETWNERF
jgi:RNA polymerase sigma factor (sigma-70 family)